LFTISRYPVEQQRHIRATLFLAFLFPTLFLFPLIYYVFWIACLPACEPFASSSVWDQSYKKLQFTITNIFSPKSVQLAKIEI
jgi:hypothetical protein